MNLNRRHRKLGREVAMVLAEIASTKVRLQTVCPHPSEHRQTSRVDRSVWHQPDFYEVTTCTFCGKELKAERVIP